MVAMQNTPLALAWKCGGAWRAIEQIELRGVEGSTVAAHRETADMRMATSMACGGDIRVRPATLEL